MNAPPHPVKGRITAHWHNKILFTKQSHDCLVTNIYSIRPEKGIPLLVSAVTQHLQLTWSALKCTKRAHSCTFFYRLKPKPVRSRCPTGTEFSRYFWRLSLYSLWRELKEVSILVWEVVSHTLGLYERDGVSPLLPSRCDHTLLNHLWENSRVGEKKPFPTQRCFCFVVLPLRY